MSRSMLGFLRSAGDPDSDTEVRDALRGVVILRTPAKLCSEFSEETRLILIESAKPMCASEMRFLKLSDEATLADDIL